MRAHDNWQRFSIATILLCLIACFAISPPEYHRRGTSAASRGRKLPAAGVDELEQDHALASADLSFDFDNSGRGNDNPAFEALFPPGNPPGVLAFAGYVLPSIFILPWAAPSSLGFARPPPSC